MSALECAIFGFKIMLKCSLELFILKFHEPLLSCCQLARPIQSFSMNFQHWAAATLKGIMEFQNKKNSRPLFTIIFKRKIVIIRAEILICRYLGQQNEIQLVYYSIWYYMDQMLRLTPLEIFTIKNDIELYRLQHTL